MLRSALLFLAVVVAVNKAECPANWTAYIHSDKCVKAFGEQMSFFGALAFCEAQGAGNGGTLVSVHSKFQNAQLGELAQTVTVSSLFWIGFYNFGTSGEYEWIDETPVDYTEWAEGYPSGNLVETAGVISMELRDRWEETAELSAPFYFFCEQNANQMPVTSTTPAATSTTGRSTSNQPSAGYGCFDYEQQFNQWCYMVREYLINFETTAEIANPHNLVSIHSKEENEFVREIVNGANTLIGLRKFGNKLYWDDGSPVDYTNFAPGFVPLNGSCIRQQEDGFWYDTRCEADNSTLLAVLKIEALEVTPRCHGTAFYTDRGVLTSPGFPHASQDSMDCKYQLAAQNGYYIIFRVVVDYKVSGDSFEIYDGWTEDGQKLLANCTKEHDCGVTPAQSTSNRMLVVFRGRSSHIWWYAQWYSTKSISANKLQKPTLSEAPAANEQISSQSDRCPAETYISSADGTGMFSPNYPFGYAANMDCIYHVKDVEWQVIDFELAHIGNDDYFEVIDTRSNTFIASTRDIIRKRMPLLFVFFDHDVRFHSGSNFSLVNNWILSLNILIN